MTITFNQWPELLETTMCKRKAGDAMRESDIIDSNTKYHGHPRFYGLLKEMADLHSRKNHDYAGSDPLSNLRAPEDIGLPAWKGVLVRLMDKWSRLKTFARTGNFEVKDEGVTDTLMDNAVYSLLCIILLEEADGKSTMEAPTLSEPKAKPVEKACINCEQLSDCRIRPSKDCKSFRLYAGKPPTPVKENGPLYSDVCYDCRYSSRSCPASSVPLQDPCPKKETRS